MGSAGSSGPAPLVGRDQAAAWLSTSYLALTAVGACLVLVASPGAAAQDAALALVAAVSITSLLCASARLRVHRVASSFTHQRDPFPLFAAALLARFAPQLAGAIGGDAAARLGEGTAWPPTVAALLAVVGYLVLFRELAPGRGLDALLLAVIAATAVGLCAWVLIGQQAGLSAAASAIALERLAAPVVDLVAVGLGLQILSTRRAAPRGCWLLLIAWTLAFAVDASRLVTAVLGGQNDGAPASVVGLLLGGLLGAWALNPDGVRVAEPIVDPLTSLPRSQMALLVAAVALGPAIPALGWDDTNGSAVIFAASLLLPLVSIAYLIRLVQGRAALEYRAHHDDLTGLANRTLFQDRASVAIAHARRTQTHSAVLFLDLDRFKTVNDSLGHAVGNLLLQAVARRLRDSTRAEDTVARLGGDEFVVFLPQLEDPETAAAVASKILERFDEPFTLKSHRLFASPSIGIAVFPSDGQDAYALLENADIAMYRAKQQGRRTFCTYDRSMNDHAHERLALESQLHTAIEHGELRLHYQPKIHLPTGRVMGMEALLRWEHPELGLLQPADFVPLAEESGLIVPVGEWALHEACRQNQEWVRAGFEPLVVAVNLSLRQFQHQRIEDVTARILRSTGLDPCLLELEVTESLAMHDPEAVRATLLDLRELGVTCSIDDFGTGYSGLSHLTGFAIDKLKIDKSFVATIDTDREAPIVVAVVALARGLGLEVVAEGVETTEQLERLRELGCDEMQGFLFSRPVPAEHFEQLLMPHAKPAPVSRLMAPREERDITLAG